MREKTIFKKYFLKDHSIDRLERDKERKIDVIIPIIGTNELWETNLVSFYREIPINRLLIGDGGCKDNSIEIVKKFPRVKIIDQSKYYSQGYCIKKLMEQVETDWFVYLHADVYLPENWYDEMIKYKYKYDWYECNRKMTVLIEYFTKQYQAKRAYSGSQIGRTSAFKNVLPKIDDDFLQRNEDVIFQGLIEEEGFKYGKVMETFHYHQIMNKKNAVSSMGEREPEFEDLIVMKVKNKDWETKIYQMQARGIIKYLIPQNHLIDAVNASISQLIKLDAFDWIEFKKWVKDTNSEWLKYINKKKIFILKVKMFIKKMLRYNK